MFLVTFEHLKKTSDACSDRQDIMCPHGNREQHIHILIRPGWPCCLTRLVEHVGCVRSPEEHGPGRPHQAEDQAEAVQGGV